ncbi:MAG: PAS-domain containing protein [Rhodospirillales bacterium]|nr:PAS-domain containing protein [Rhodospirillales bacterium]
MSELTPIHTFLAGALIVALVALVAIVRLRKRLSDTESQRQRLEALAIKAREMLASTPDGLFLWDHANGGFTCSRRLAVLLDLDAGIQSRYDDIRPRFEGDSLKALEQCVSLLRGNGTPFDLLLTSGHRKIQAIGSRAETEDGQALADMVWMRDVTGTGAGGVDEAGDAVDTGHRIASVNTSGLEDRHLTALLDAMPLPVWLRDSKLSLAFVNLAGQGIAAADPAMATTAREQGQSITERRSLGDANAVKILEVTETPLGILGGGEDGRTGGTIGFAIDRSEAQEKETQSSRLAEARDAVLETLDAAIAFFNNDTKLVFFNSAYQKLWDLDRDWLETQPGLDEILERLRDQRSLPEVANFREFKMDLLELFETLTDAQEDLLHLPDGRALRALVNRQGKDGLVFVFEDVTDRLDLERSNKSLGAVQRETLDNLHEGIAVFGSDGRLKLHNPVFMGLWRFDEDTLDEKYHLNDFVNHTRDMTAVEGGWDDLSWGVHKEKVMARLMGREQTTGKLEFATGTVVEYANVPLPDGAMLLSYLDVTDSAKVEQALRQRAEAFAEADQLKSKFIANVSHEVRTPLNTIVGFADMLGQEYFGTLNRRQGEYARGILDTTRGLMSLVGDILDLASIEAGNMELDRDTVDVHGLLVSALNLIQERARSKDLKLEFDCPPDIGWIAADEKRLKQVVFNLLSNAITFTPELGTVRLESRRENEDLIITVADTGIGIPQADRDRVFHPFEQSGGEKSDKSGAGLGLSLVKNFIEMHGGDVDIKSPPGRGTTITCRLPTKGGHADDADKER